MATTQSPEFKQAALDAKNLKAKPSQDEMLQLYGYFKQGTQDPPITETPAPGTFDFVGKAKKKAWQKVVDEGTTPEAAQQKYVELVEQLKEKLGFNA